MRLSYTHNSLGKSTLVDDNKRPIYRATKESHFFHHNKVHIEKLTNSKGISDHLLPGELATITLGSNKISWRGGPERKIREWLPRKNVLSSKRMFAAYNSQATYEWDCHFKGYWTLSVSVFDESGQAHEREVVRSHTASYGLLGGEKHTPYLEIEDRAASLDLDDIVVSYVFVEMDMEQQQQQAATASASNSATVAAVA